jgi:hypothetical protein
MKLMLEVLARISIGAGEPPHSNSEWPLFRLCSLVKLNDSYNGPGGDQSDPLLRRAALAT